VRTAIARRGSALRHRHAHRRRRERRRRRLPFDPRAFDLEDLARVIGVAGEVEFITEDRDGTNCHFAGEVLHVRPERSFPWRLLSVWEWAAEQYLNGLSPEDAD